MTYWLHGKFGQPYLTRPHTLCRVVTKLVDNAIKFGTDAEILLNVELPAFLLIIVQDRGPGIPPAELEAVFQPFYRIENSRNRESGGSGLGLAITQQFSTHFDGHLSLSNREGGGLLARLCLPLGEFTSVQS